MKPAAAPGSGAVWEFGAFRLNARERELSRHGERVQLSPKAFDTLVLLVRHGGQVLTKAEILQEVWPDTFVEENNLAQHISQLRRALSDGGLDCIETVPKFGYRFLPDVRELPSGLSEVQVPEEAAPHKSSGDAAVEITAPVQPGTARDSPRLSGPVRWIWWAGGAVVVAAAVAAWNASSSSSSPGRDSAPIPVRLTFDSGLTMEPALSADGTLLAFASDRDGNGPLQIWLRSIGGTEPARLTHGSADASEPTFSPDGRTVAFRSEEDGGGIYTISVHGGETRLVAQSGRRPRFSPDGRWLAYWVGTETSDNSGSFMVPGAGRVFVVSATGGAPRQLHPEFAASGYPIWAPDGRHVLFLGNRDPNIYHEGTMDWWVASLDSDAVARTGAAAAFTATAFASASQIPEAWMPDGTGVLMSATLGDSRNIWDVPISLRDWKVAGAPRRLTFGTTVDMQPSVARKRLVFASLIGTLNMWSLPMDADRADPKDKAERLTDNALAHSYPAVSNDGSEVAFSLQRAGNRDIWIRDLKTGNEREVSLPPGPSFNPNFSPDGTALAYRTAEHGTSKAYVVSLEAGGTQTICEDCSDYGWSSDDKRLVLVGKAPARVSILDLASRSKTALLQHATYQLWNARFSPDDRWVAFNATEPGQSRIYVARVGNAGLVPEQDWITIADSRWDDKPRWSPDGNTIYFVSERDGFRCIWAQRLDAQKRPLGSATAVFHAHARRRSLSNVGPGDLSISVARDKIVFNMGERTGDLWMMDVDAGR
jgi:Tol biopolymer transport system component/DNA-binding winged helix-turn-helix (wHTH) protein